MDDGVMLLDDTTGEGHAIFIGFYSLTYRVTSSFGGHGDPITHFIIDCCC